MIVSEKQGIRDANYSNIGPNPSFIKMVLLIVY